jgi:hypothetical protein
VPVPEHMDGKVLTVGGPDETGTGQRETKTSR